ncbi:MAG: glycosyltransferase family 39 protein [Verrucomicrobiia bacterium]|jgi:4-amino-4-deoxy-L-arabinose transferase-like glycosyltransferase
MISRRIAYSLAASLLAVMAALMLTAMREETATVDETVFLGAGYSYWLGHGFQFNPEHPPLAQLWSALPLRISGAALSPKASQLLGDHLDFSNAARWDYSALPMSEAFPKGRDFYYWPRLEAELFGHSLVYGGGNDAEHLLFCGRLMQVVITLVTGWVIFAWARSLSNELGGLLALVTWVFNPIALAYGHLILTDPAIALLFPLTIWMYSRFLQTPNGRTMSMAGLAFGGALLAKFTAILLFPVLAALTLMSRRQLASHAHPTRFFGYLLGFAAIAWAMILMVYAPGFSPPPAISPQRAELLNVPAWFCALRPVLIPSPFFKGLAIFLAHASSGHEAYLCGQWSMSGWWYYYPAALWFKLPIPLLLAAALALSAAVRRLPCGPLLQAAPLIGALLYLTLAMVNKVDIGVRHLLPMFPMLSVVIGIEAAQARRPAQIVSSLLVVWLAILMALAHPFYIQYFNEFAGGSKNGYQYLLDSNLDWGQDVKRLKRFLDNRHITHIYINYFHSLAAVEYYQIPHTYVDPDRAQEIHEGYLIVSATHLMRPEWAWLRQQHQPVACIAYTLFVYRLP